MAAAKSYCALFVVPLVWLFAPGGVAHATGIDQNSTSLPPSGVYLTPAAVHADYPVGPTLDIILSNIQHQPFTTGVVRTIVNGGADETEQFNSQVTGDASINGGPLIPVTGTGPVDVLVHGYGLSQTGTFQTQMLSLDITLTGPGLPGPVMIRQSPTLPTIGQTTITPIGGGMFHIDSFFDVFTELSLDNGVTWTPSTSSTHVDLNPVPEPNTGLLVFAGLLGLGGRRRARV